MEDFKVDKTTGMLQFLLLVLVMLSLVGALFWGLQVIPEKVDNYFGIERGESWDTGIAK